jgi:hypothetical protein
MAIDKELYRTALEYYRQWNEAELLDRLRNAGSSAPDAEWLKYIDLWEFGWRMGLRPSQRQHSLTMAEWTEYYDRLQRFETWRRERDRAS